MLRIADVADKTFTTTRLREGYEMAEVDTFLTDVTEAITVRDQVISELQMDLDAARQGPAGANVDRGNDDGNRRETSAAAARLLEMATVNADQLVADAKTEAESLVAAARAEADKVITATRAEAERADAELAQRKERQAFELERQRTTVLAEVAEKKAALQMDVDSLLRLESETRDRLRRHFSEQLAKLEDTTPPVPLAAVGD